MTADQRRISDLQGRIYRKQVVIKGLQADNTAKDERIAELETELAGHEWISIEDGLPKHEGYFQVLRVENPCPSTRYYVKDGIWQSGATVTHWKYITLPKKEGE